MSDVLVIGHSGQLATALQSDLASADWRFLNRKDLDLSVIDTIEQKLAGYPFKILIVAAAYTAVDAAEDASQLAETINGEALISIAEACVKRDAWLIHISTDYVFDGQANTPYKETDATSPTGVYGRSKLNGEQNIRKICSKHIIIRTSWLYGAHGHNFANTMLRLGQTRKELSVVFDQVGTPTFVEHLAALLIRITRADLSIDVAGTYHFSNEGVASWYDFALAIFELCGTEVTVHPVRSAQFPTKAKRPAYSVMDKQKIKDTFDFQILHWRDALRTCLEKTQNLNA